MKVINARNVGEALLVGLDALQKEGVPRDSRNGPVLVFPTPVTTFYRKPQERVLFYPERGANPFFHFMESLWMLAGRRDVEFPSRFAGTIANYSDDGVNFHGAYGYRWRNHFTTTEYEQPGAMHHDPIKHTYAVDQLATIAQLLKNNQDDRRVVLQMWDAEADLGLDGKDFPCNLMANFSINPYGKLDMTVFNRSNDIIWGAYGANAVHFSILQEVMAAWVGVPMGSYWQISTNFHGYKNIIEKHKGLLDLSFHSEPYASQTVQTIPVVNGPIENWFQDLEMFMAEGAVMGFQDRFFKKTAAPMLKSWEAWKEQDISKAIGVAMNIEAPDWRRACVEWLERKV